MPAVKEGESREEYMKRCVPVVRAEGASEEAAVGKCEGMYDEHQKKRKKQKASRPIFPV